MADFVPDSRWLLREFNSREPRVAATLPAGNDINPLVLLRVQTELERCLGECHDPRRPLGVLAQPLARLPRERQDRALHWVAIIARTNTDLAREYAERATQADILLESDGLEQWLLRAMAEFDHRGIGAAVAVLDSLEMFAREFADSRFAVTFDEVNRGLSLFVAGLGGRELKLASAPETFTDTETIHLPECLGEMETQAANQRLYRAMAVCQWAQVVFGTWQVPITEALCARPEPVRRDRFLRFEAVRLVAELGRRLPGLAAQLQALARTDGGRNPDSALLSHLLGTEAGAECSLRLADGAMPAPAAPAWMGIALPERVQQRQQHRVQREQVALRRRLHKVLAETRATREDGIGARKAEFRYADTASPNAARVEAGSLSVDGEVVDADVELAALVVSISHDHGTVPPDFLNVGSSGDYKVEPGREGARPIAAASALGDEAFTYPEWDCTRDRFRSRYCIVRERPLAHGDTGFLATTLTRHRGLVKTLRKSFEVLVADSGRQRRLEDGDDIDLDALVAAQVDMRVGCVDERWYTALNRPDRSVAVMVMVDMSGSTRGWVNLAEREAVVLLSEALEILGDRYAVYGFSGRTHKRCEVYPVKRFDEDRNPAVIGRIDGITPKGYTRIGAAVRHLSGLLAAQSCTTRLLVVLSDGKPEDYGSYRGEYGIQDTRHALNEARAKGIRAYCVTIDKEGADYLGRMYGASGYTVISEVAQLPLRIADIYRRVTT